MRTGTKRKLSLLLGDSDDDSIMNQYVNLPEIIKNIPDANESEAKRHVKYSPHGTTVQLLSPNKKDVMTIRNCKVNIVSDPSRFVELQHIEDQITSMKSVPDFGYENDNFLLENTDAPRNWELMTGLLSGKHRHEWLRTHIAIRKINHEKSSVERKKQ